MATTINFKGLRELGQALDTLPDKLQVNVMRGALRAGARVILNDAKSRVPVKSGRLRDSLKVSTSGKGGEPKATVRTREFYAPFVEYGTGAHKIVAAPKGVLRFLDEAVAVVDHPGTAPKPFMRPALDAQATAAVVAAAEHMKKRLANKHGLDTADVQIEAEE